MNENQAGREATTSKSEIPLAEHAALPLGSVPVFTCVVHLLRREDGSVQARVANLPDLVCFASNDREAMAKVVKEFKQRISSFLEASEAIPWIEPVSPKVAEETTRFIPVHL